jgi:hypothetical protein
VCALPWLGQANEVAGKPDSAIATYERYLALGDPERVLLDGIWRAVILRRLGFLHMRGGNTAKAIERFEQFAMLWKDADPELRPQVEEARAYVVRLRSSGTSPP